MAKKSSVPARERAAQMILKNMREHSETLVQQEFMVGTAAAQRVCLRYAETVSS